MTHAQSLSDTGLALESKPATEAEDRHTADDVRRSDRKGRAVAPNREPRESDRNSPDPLSATDRYRLVTPYTHHL